jgi:hypothetical protein
MYDLDFKTKEKTPGIFIPGVLILKLKLGRNYAAA